MNKTFDPELRDSILQTWLRLHAQGGRPLTDAYLALLIDLAQK